MAAGRVTGGIACPPGAEIEVEDGSKEGSPLFLVIDKLEVVPPSLETGPPCVGHPPSITSKCEVTEEQGVLLDFDGN